MPKKIKTPKALNIGVFRGYTFEQNVENEIINLSKRMKVYNKMQKSPSKLKGEGQTDPVQSGNRPQVGGRKRCRKKKCGENANEKKHETEKEVHALFHWRNLRFRLVTLNSVCRN